MSLARKNIRDAAVAVLKGNTLAGDRVFGNRFKRIPDNQAYPIILVYSLEETAKKLADGPVKYRRDVTLVTRGLVDLNAKKGADQLDLLAAQIEQLMSSAGHLLATASMEPILASVTLDEDSSEKGDVALGIIDVNWTVPYVSDLPLENPKDLGILNQINVDYEAEVADSDATASDEITLEQ